MSIATRARVEDVKVEAPVPGDCAGILTPEALGFIAKLHRSFDGRRRALLERRGSGSGGARPRLAS